MLRFVNKRYTSYLLGKIHPTLLIPSQLIQPYFVCGTQVRSDWESVKIDVMYRALKCKFSIYPHLNSMLLSTAGSVLVEASPHDLFWGGGRDGEGLNYLGRLLMQLRSEFLGEPSSSTESTCLAV